MLNKNDGKWFSKNLKPINSGIGLNEQQSYLEAKATAYKAEQANRKTTNDLQHFSSTLLECTSSVFKPLTTIQNKSLEQEKKIVAQLKNAHILDPLKAIENKPGDVMAIEAKDDKHVDINENVKQETTSLRLPDQRTLSKNECINLIKSDDNMDELFGITEYKDNIIRFHIFENLYKYKLIKIGIYHKIEFIEEIDRTLIKSSRTKDGKVIKDISFPATRELMIALTKDVGGDFDKNALDQYKAIYDVCLKPDLNKHIFKLLKGRPSKNHINFLNT